MKNSELEAILKKARTPEIPSESLDAFPQTILRQLNGHKSGGNVGSTRSFRWAWALGFAACVLIAVGTIYQSTEKLLKTKKSSDFLTSVELIRQTMALFPNRVRAIVDDGRGLNVVLSDHEDVPSSAPIYVRICDGSHCSSMVTFSGQVIQVDEQKLAVLSAPHGEIILAGEQFVWSSRGHLFAGNRFHIDAKNIGSAIL